MNLGSRIRFYRTLKGLSQGELASRLRMASSQLSRYENGHTQPRFSMLARIARALGIRVSDFFF
jgi:transcriptional regulator with XRE-family HTH domain